MDGNAGLTLGGANEAPSFVETFSIHTGREAVRRTGGPAEVPTSPA